MTLALILVGSYLLGAVPTSFLAARYGAGIDLRTRGSKNLGATNVYRVLGWRYAVPVGAFDIAKGAVPVLLLAPLAGDNAWIPLAAGFSAILGHVFSVFVRFQGGKGVATATGVVLGLAPLAVAASAIVWLAALKLSGFVSLSSILGAVTFPVAAWFLQADPYTIWVGIALSGFIIYTHRANIHRLMDGTESRFGRRRET